MRRRQNKGMHANTHLARTVANIFGTLLTNCPPSIAFNCEAHQICVFSDSERDLATFEAVIGQELSSRIRSLFSGGMQGLDATSQHTQAAVEDLDALGELLCWITCMWRIDMIAGTNSCTTHLLQIMATPRRDDA
jgi:hypothetical protein